VRIEQCMSSAEPETGKCPTEGWKKTQRAMGRRRLFLVVEKAARLVRTVGDNEVSDTSIFPKIKIAKLIVGPPSSLASLTVGESKCPRKASVPNLPRTSIYSAHTPKNHVTK
jgi:hypothetical protein